MIGWNESESLGLRIGPSQRLHMGQPRTAKRTAACLQAAPRDGIAGGGASGLIPHFCEKRPDFAPIHARAETVAENEWFRDAYCKRRCVVPMNSFFQKNSSGKRYAISRRDGEPFGVAGIWENWRNPETDTWERTFAVIMAPVNELIAPIHDRMLTILSNDQSSRRLSDEADPRDLLVPFPEDQLVLKLHRSRI
jgi:putative SOS response-associated peptidase YedK